MQKLYCFIFNACFFSAAAGQAPTVDFTFDNDNKCSGTVIQFTSSVTNGTAPYTYLWNFGDATTASAPSPTHIFTSLGCSNQTYNVSLKVTDANGVSNTTVKPITVKQVPNVQVSDQNNVFTPFSNCSKNPTPSNPNYSITINNSSPSAACIISYSVDWGDGSPIQNNVSFPLSHTYTQLGAFNLTVSAVGSNGCSNSKTYLVANQSNPAGSLGTLGSTTGLCAPATVPFTITNWQLNSPGTTYNLNFGDGNSISLKHPLNPNYTTDTVLHTYTTSSCPNPTFTATLQVINACATTPYTAGNIQVRIKPIASFTSPPSGCINQNICFSNTTIAGNTGNNCSATTVYSWDFGDGSAISSTLNPCHSYSAPGTYTVTLTATNPCGTTTFSKQVCITNPIIPSFTLDKYTGCFPLTVNATNTSTPTSGCSTPTYLWTVTYASAFCGTSSSVSPSTSTLANPTFTFNNPGTYTIRQSVTSGCGTVSTTQTVTVKKPPTVSLSNIANGCAPLTINPSATVTNCGTVSLNYLWSFPGGTPSSASSSNPGPILYSTAGSYTISLAVSNECGTTTANQSILVGAVPDLTVPNNITVCAGAIVGPLSFSSTTTGVTYSWTNSNPAIGLGSSGTNNPIPAFNANNNTTSSITSTITVTARTSTGCTIVKTFTITVNPRPTIINYTPTICSGGTFTTTPTSSIIPAGTTYSWAVPVVTGGITGGAAGSNQTSISGTLINPTNTPQTATYTVTPISGASGNCMGATFTVRVTVNPIPQITAVPNNPTSCSSSNGFITISGLAANTNYNIQYLYNSTPRNINLTSNTSGVITISGLAAGVYDNITVTSNGCISNSVGPFTLTTPLAPATPTASSNSPLCSGGTLHLTASPTIPGGVYTWSGPSFSATGQTVSRNNVSMAMAGTYNVTVTLNGCTSPPATVVVVINQTPTSPTVTTPVNYCLNEVSSPLNATALVGNTLQWYTVATGGVPSATPPTPNTSIVGITTYYVSQINSTTPVCESGRATIIVNVRPIPSISGTSINPTSCTSSDGRITINGLTPNTIYTVQYLRNGNPVTISPNPTSNSSGSITVTNLSAGIYSDIAVTLNGCRSNTLGPFTLINPSAPSTPTATSNSPLCAGATLILTSNTSTSGVTYSWSGPAGYTSSQQNPTRTNVTTAMSGNYTITVSANGCTSSATVNVVINAAPAAPMVTTPINYCQNASAVPLTATAAGNNTLNWYTAATGGTPSATAPTPITTSVGNTYYYVSQTNASGCESPRAVITVTVNASPVISATSNNPTTCASSNGSIVITGLLANTSYSVGYAKNGVPTTLSLSSNGTGVITIPALGSGNYTNITVTIAGCTSNSVGPFTITNPGGPAAPTASSNSPLCSGGTLNLTSNSSTPGGTYSWTGPGGFTSAQQNPVRTNITAAMSGNYSVTVTLNGCTSSAATVNVIIDQSPATPVVSSNSPLCEGNSLNLSASSATTGVDYTWTGPNGFTSSIQNPVLTGVTTAQSGSYTVTTTSPQNNCKSTAATSVIIRSTPVIINATYADPSGCTSANGSITLTGLAANTTFTVQYTKNGNAVTTSLSSGNTGNLVIPNLSAGTYTNIVVVFNGCSSAAAGPFTLVNPSSPATPTAGSNSPLCAGSTLQLTASSLTSEVTYSWTGPNGFSSSLQNPIINNASVQAAGSYSVTASINGCISGSASVNVVINTVMVPTISANSPLCAGATLILTSNISAVGYMYQWSGPNGFTSTLQNPSINNITATNAGTYSLIVTSPANCSSQAATTLVTVNPVPSISGSFTDPANCSSASGSITLDGLTPNTTYSIQYTKNNGTPTTISLVSNGSGVIVLTGLTGGVYSNITVTRNGCSSNIVGPFTLVEAFNLPETPKAASNSPLCVGSTLMLSSSTSTAGVTYSWTGPNGFNSTLQNPSISNITIPASGKYYVNARLNNCTSLSDSVIVQVGDFPAVDLGPDLTLAPGSKYTMNPVITNGPITTYLWNPTTNLSCTNCPSPIADIKNDISYTLKVTNAFGCSDTDTINIKVVCDNSQVFIPDAFTPDGDGINDLFIIRSSGSITVKHFRIFNKWGQLIFEKLNFPSNSATYAWDGKIKGIVAAPDVFVYTAEVMCANGTRFTYKGNVSILK